MSRRSNVLNPDIRIVFGNIFSFGLQTSAYVYSALTVSICFTVSLDICAYTCVHSLQTTGCSSPPKLPNHSVNLRDYTSGNLKQLLTLKRHKVSHFIACYGMSRFRHNLLHRLYMETHQNVYLGCCRKLNNIYRTSCLSIV